MNYRLKNKKNILGIFYLVIAFFLLSFMTYAGSNIYNEMSVNGESIPELDKMYNVKHNKPKIVEVYKKNAEKYSSYKEIQKDLGIKLLGSNLSDNNPYTISKLKTDGKDYAIIKCQNYILGDTSDYKYISKEKCYDYKSGTDYYSPISLDVHIILSETQNERGWDSEFLGMYKFKESYVSSQGYKVNIIEDTTENPTDSNYISKKTVIFVADGIRYTLSGRTSVKNMKNIVETMKYKN